MDFVLEVKELSVRYPDGFVLQPLSFRLAAGETLAVVGESGSGKTTLANAILGLGGCGQETRSGRVWLQDAELTALPEKQLKHLRMRRFSVVFQNAREWLNPAATLREQLYEVLLKELPKAACPARAAALMESVGLQAADLARRPHELSGGMVQRFLLAQAIALTPPLVVLDEPTSALDAAARADFIALIQNLQRATHTAFLLITHDLLLAQTLAARTLVLYHGLAAEAGDTALVLGAPAHPYTAGLVRAAAELDLYRDLWGIRPGAVPQAGCPFAGRCTQALPACGESLPAPQTLADGRVLRCHRGGVLTLLKADGLCKRYGAQQVLKDAAFRVQSGETVTVTGASGSGKTTLVSIAAGFLQPDAGALLWQGSGADFALLHRQKGGVQFVMQDAADAVNPALTVGDAVAEPLTLSGERDAMPAVRAALDAVGLPCTDEFLARRVRSLSGGQKQRAALARALTMQPALLIADEPTSMLDVSSKANLLRMLKGLQNQRGFSLLMVTHDLAASAKIADRVYHIENGVLRQKPKSAGEVLE